MIRNQKLAKLHYPSAAIAEALPMPVASKPLAELLGDTWVLENVRAENLTSSMQYGFDAIADTDDSTSILKHRELE